MQAFYVWCVSNANAGAVLQVPMSTSEAGVASDHRGRSKQPGLLKRAAEALRRRRHGEPGHSSGSMFVPTRHPSADASVAALDFSGWLLRGARPQDHVVLHVDIAGAKFEVSALWMMFRCADVFSPQFPPRSSAVAALQRLGPHIADHS